jgi:hypothetical protein
MIVMTTRWSSAQLEKKKEKNKKQVDRGKGINRFLFYTQDTIEGVSDLGSIVVLWRGEFHGWNGYQVSLGEFIWAYALGPSVS